MLKKKIVIVGCGKLAAIVAKACVNGLLPDYVIIGAYSRSVDKGSPYCIHHRYSKREKLFGVFLIGRSIGSETRLH